jgi:hypothetical protein
MGKDLIDREVAEEASQFCIEMNADGEPCSVNELTGSILIASGASVGAEKVRVQPACVMPTISWTLIDLLEGSVFKAAISTHSRIPT